MPMKNSNTVFQIENGTMDKFWEIWDEKGVDGLEITLQDNGYSELMQSFQNTRKMSVILLGAGIGAVLLILLFFCHMFVTKQKTRTDQRYFTHRDDRCYNRDCHWRPVYRQGSGAVE